jgi:nitrate reductase gamma subunit
MNDLLLIALPYASMVIFIAGLIWRYRSRMSITSRSSLILEKRWLLVGAVPFHFGIVMLVLGHLLPLLIPGLWRTLVSNRTALLTVETIGSVAAILCILGLAALLVRRLASRKVLAASTFADVIVLLVLIAQVGGGLAVAVLHRWGSVWSVGTTTPYLRSLFTFQPAPEFVAGVPPLMMAHLAGAWIVLALIPFTRLVHLFAFPLRYLGRRPQKVVWARSA